MGYRVAEFANLTGVTVRALQHYDRLGLLRPSRTESGHRMYAESDQARVRHILALRAVGMSLQQIRDALDAPASRLAELFQVQRTRLERSRTGIEEALGALQQVEAAFGNAGPGPLDRLASAVEMQDVLESMRTYFTDEAWTKWGRHYFHDWPSAAWRAAFRDRWPRELQRRYAEFRIAEIVRFLGAASMESWRRRGLVHAYTTGRRSTA